MKILVIDDEALMRDLISQLLQTRGWAVMEAPDGRAGLAQARQHLPDLILCDYDMMGMNGYEILAELRTSPATASIPFILVTGATDRVGVRQTMELGADDYLTKPFSEAALFKSVEARLARVRTAREQATQKLAALRSNIIAALPHELKTPLNGILGFSDLLVTDYEAFSREEVGEMLRDIRQSARALDRLIDRFFGYAELVLMTAIPAAQRKPASAASAAEARSTLETVTAAVAQRHHRQADLRLQLTEDGPAVAATVLARLTEELIDNACKFSAPGSPIELRGSRQEDCFILTVSDAGRGLTAEQIADAGALLQFDRHRHEQQGVGLGLATVRLLAESQGGALTLHSEPGRGTTARVTLPASEDLLHEDEYPGS